MDSVAEMQRVENTSLQGAMEPGTVTNRAAAMLAKYGVPAAIGFETAHLIAGTSPQLAPLAISAGVLTAALAALGTEILDRPSVETTPRLLEAVVPVRSGPTLHL